MRVFIRMMAICWAVMLVLGTVVSFWPAASAPILDDRQRTLPVLLLQSCAKTELQEMRAGGSSAAEQHDQKCPGAHLVSVAGATKKDLQGRELSPQELRVVHRAQSVHATAVQMLADSTIIAFDADPTVQESPIYLTTLSMPKRNFFLWRLNRTGRFIFISGLLSFLVAIYFVRPITRLSAVAEQFGQGDLKSRVGPSLAKRKDELGDLGRTFNGMADRIESVVAHYKSFLAHASHELGSPLTRLNLALELAKRKGGLALEQEHERIRQEADRLNSLVQELLLLARLESGNELGREQVDFNISPVVQEAFENAAFESKRSEKLVVIVRMANFSVRGYPDMLLRALDNVLRNGLRFAHRRVQIEVSYVEDQSSGRGIIVIEDDGPGVPAGDEETIFEPFFTGAQSQSETVPSGSGLGLAIARQAAIANGGNVFARRSTLGGLAVRFEVPAHT